MSAMTKYRYVAAAALSVLALACSADVSVDIVKFADRACACKDKACAEGVLEEFTGFLAKNQDASGDEKKASDASKRLGGCLVEKGVPQGELRKALDAALGEKE